MQRPNIFRRYRQMLGGSQQEIADLIGVNQTIISRLETGCGEVSDEMRRRVIAILGIPAEELEEEAQKG